MSPSPVRLVLHPNPCLNGWAVRTPPPYPVDHYTGAHFCDRDGGHPGRCRCVCGARGTLQQQGDGR
jgi:hypothetical protein